MSSNADRINLQQEFSIVIPDRDDIKIIRDILCEESVTFGHNSVVMTKNIGSFTYFGAGSEIYSVYNIGRYCSIGQDVLAGAGPHPTNWLSTSPFFYRKKMWKTSPMVAEFYDANPLDYLGNAKQINIGNDVWIGSRAIILAGVKIGDGAIIAAGAVVTKDVPPYSIVAGVPAKVLRYRFEEKTVQRLIETEWWTVNPLLIKGMDYSDVPRLIEEIAAIKSGENWQYRPKNVIISA